MTEAKGLLSPTAAQMVEAARRRRVQEREADEQRRADLRAKRTERQKRRYNRWRESGGRG